MSNDLCSSWFMNSLCTDPFCAHRHGLGDLLSSDTEAFRLKVFLCRHWIRGSCGHGNTCKYAHGVSDVVVCETIPSRVKKDGSL